MRKFLRSSLGYSAGDAPAPTAPSDLEQELGKAFYEDDIKALRGGMRMLFTNQMEEAETAFKAGFLSPTGSIKPPLPAYARDNRASYAFPYALTAMFRGLASLENEQLADCLTRLRTCEEICDASVQWLGHKLLRGIVSLSLGIVELTMQKYLSGAAHVVKSWWLLKGVEEEVDAFEGPERLEVRSLMQLVCGAIEVAVSALPPGLLKAAKLVGFKCDLMHGRELIYKCYTEDGLLAPVAALFVSIFLVETKPTLGAPPTAEELESVENVLKWADERFPSSSFFLMVRAGLHFHNRELAACATCMDELEPLVSAHPAFALLVHWTRGRNALLLRDWIAAGDHYQAAIDIHVKVGRRSWVPCMALFAGLAYAAGGDIVRRDAMWSLVMAYKAMKKSNWRDEDKGAFELAQDFMSASALNADLEILFILKRMQQLRGMPAESAEKLSIDLHNRIHDFQPNDAAIAWLVLAEMSRIGGGSDDVLQNLEEVVKLKDSLSPRMVRQGLLAEVWFTKTVVCIADGRLEDAKTSLKEINGSLLNKMNKADRMDFDFKKTALSSWLFDANKERVALSGEASTLGDEALADNDDTGFLSADEDEHEMQDLEAFVS